jgi:ankyrin repeat protein
MSRSEAANALFAAIRAGDQQAVGAALAAEPALAAARNAAGVSAVLWACYTRQAGALAALLAAGPELDVFEAVAAGAGERAEALLAADPALAAAWSADGFTALHLAAFFGHEALALRLLALGADAGAPAREATHVTPLHSAAAARSAGIARALLVRGADPDARQAGGYTALMAAAQLDDRALAGLLLAHGADPALRADDGRAAADFADEKGHHALAALLRGSAGGE